MTGELLAPHPQELDPDQWAAACGRVRSLCGWHIAPQVTETITVNGSGTPLLMLPTMHLVAVTDVTIDGYVVDNPRPKVNGVVLLSYLPNSPVDPQFTTWGDGWGDITLTITHGYPVCPDELLEVTKRIARAPQVWGKRMQAGPFSIQDPGLPPDDRETLELYTIRDGA